MSEKPITSNEGWLRGLSTEFSFGGVRGKSQWGNSYFVREGRLLVMTMTESKGLQVGQLALGPEAIRDFCDNMRLHGDDGKSCRGFSFEDGIWSLTPWKECDQTR